MNHLHLIIVLLLGLFFSTNGSAQTFRLSGNLINQDNIPVEFATVQLLHGDSTMQSRALTDSVGGFLLEAEAGTYVLHIQLLGQELHQQPLLLTSDMNLGRIVINESSELEGLVVTAGKKIIERKADRLVYNVENSTAASGGNALDVLKSTPLVRVQNDVVSIVGKGEVLVMIDDRLQRMSSDELAVLLQSIPSENIRSIEVITTPPAGYDAEGNGGLINIRLKTAKENSWNATIGATYRQKTYAGGTVMGTFHYNHKKWAVNVALNGGKQDYLTTSESRIFYPKEYWRSQLKDHSKTHGFSVRGGVDYKAHEKWTTGFKYMGNFTGETNANQPFTSRTNPFSGSANGFIRSDVKASNRPEMHSVNWFNAITPDSVGTRITTDVDYFSYHKNDERFFEGNELDMYQHVLSGTYFSSNTTNMNRIENVSGKLDVEKPMKWASLTVGAKFSYTQTNNDLKVTDYETGTPVLNTNQSNVFRYREYNEALHASMNKKIGERWEAQAGLRAEATQTEGYSQNLDQAHRNNYIKLFPTAYLTYTPNEIHSLSLNYSRRIRRPGFDYLNPFIIRTSPYYYSEGNPFLQPSMIDNVEFSYMHRQKWVSSVYYSQVSDFSQQMSILDAQTNVTRSTPLNYANTYQVGISMYYNFSQWSWWNSFSGFNVNYQNVRSHTTAIASIDGYNAYLYSNNDFTLNPAKTLFVSVNYGLQLPGRYQIFHISTMHLLDVSVKYLLLNKKLAVTLTVQDLVNGQRPLISYSSNGVETNFRTYDDTRGFKISLSYQFGNNKLKTTEKSFGNEEERERAE